MMSIFCLLHKRSAHGWPMSEPPSKNCPNLSLKYSITGSSILKPMRIVVVQNSIETVNYMSI